MSKQIKKTQTVIQLSVTVVHSTDINPNTVDFANKLTVKGKPGEGITVRGVSVELLAF